MRNEKIAARQLWFILFLMRTTTVLAYLPVLTSADAFQDAWISSIITLIGSEVFVLLVSLLVVKFPDKTIIEYSQLLLGNWIGKLMGLLFLWLFLQLSVVDIRIYAELITTGFLPNTPQIFIIGIMVLLATICVEQGIEIVARMADVLFFVFIIMVFFVILISLTEFNFQNIQPIYARGMVPILRGAMTPIALISQIWVLGMLTPTVVRPEKTVKVALTSIGVSIIILIIATFVTIGVLSPKEAARATFPLLSLMRSIRVSSFLERMEILVIFSWGFGLFISISTYMYSGAQGLAQWLSLKDYRAIIWPMAVIWIFLTVQGFDDIFALYNFLKLETFAPYGFALLIFPLLILWSAYLIRKNTGTLGGKK